jgi:hypothetical protein
MVMPFAFDNRVGIDMMTRMMCCWISAEVTEPSAQMLMLMLMLILHPR